MGPAVFHRASGGRVCVMDASGHVGTSLVRRLLRRGYNVHAATQNSSGDLFGVKGLSAYENGRLKIFHSDPFDYQSIVEALKGCSGLFYTFEPPPVQEQPNYIYDELTVEVEARAAHNVLEACAQTETMHKVVFTSSVTAVVWNENHKSVAAAADLDEKNWSDTNFCRNFKLWHAVAKTLAEKTAWALAMDRGVNMVSVNAGLLTGPELTVTNPYLMGAADMYEDGVLVTVSAEFLADAHVCAYEDPSAYGRYLCFDRLIDRHEDAVNLAQILTPSSPCSPLSDDHGRITKQRIHNKKLKNLMLDFDGGLEMEEGVKVGALIGV